MSEQESASDEADLDEDEEAPRVLLATLGDLGAAVPQDLAKRYGARPVWFLLEMDAELAEVFERLPEDPMPKTVSEAIMAALRRFASERSDDLQRVLGVTDAIEFGFHVDATLDRVRSSFEEDGFDVVGAIRAGDVVAE